MQPILSTLHRQRSDHVAHMYRIKTDFFETLIQITQLLRHSYVRGKGSSINQVETNEPTSGCCRRTVAMTPMQGDKPKRATEERKHTTTTTTIEQCCQRQSTGSSEDTGSRGVKSVG